MAGACPGDDGGAARFRPAEGTGYRMAATSLTARVRVHAQRRSGSMQA